MRRFIVSLLLAGAVLPSAGCVFAMDMRGVPHHRQVVEIDGELYIVNLKTRRVKRMEAVWEVRDEAETTKEVVVED